MFARRLITWIGALALLAQSAIASADWQMNMYRGVTPISQSIYNLHMTSFLVCVAIGIAVFSVMIYSLIYHRKSRGFKPATFHENTKVELLWAFIPFLILIILAIPATKTLIAMEDNSDSDISIKVVGYQWKWEYQYLNEGIKFFSNLKTPFDQIQGKAKKDKWYLLDVDNEVVVPIHKKIRFLVTANDVIHSWWVPELGVKRDAIPGFIHEAWARIDKPGVYRGQCAELCGVYHGFMPIVVRAVTEKEYDEWVKARQPKPEPKLKAGEKKKTMVWSMKLAMKKGEEKYKTFCVACHKADGTGMPPVFPALKGSSIAVGKPISRHINNVLNGVSGTAMQAFGGQLSDKEIAAIVTYERNAWGNNTGDLVKPEDIRELRKD